MLPSDLALNMLLYDIKRTRLLSSHRRQFIVETFTKYFQKPNRAIAIFFNKTLRIKDCSTGSRNGDLTIVYVVVCLSFFYFLIHFVNLRSDDGDGNGEGNDDSQ